MRIGRRQALIIAVACGVLAALLSYTYLRRAGATKQQPKAKAPTMVNVATAAVDIHIAQPIGPGMVSIKHVEQGKAPAGAYTSESQIAGSVALAPISAGEPLTPINVGRQGTVKQLSFQIPEDMRAVTVSVDPVSGVAGLITSGDHVDVLATFTLKSNTSVTRTVLQDVLVLALGPTIVTQPAEGGAGAKGGAATKGGAAGQQTEGKGAGTKYVTATLAVTPVDAERLVLADSKAKLRLSLRRKGDTTYATIPSADNWQLMGVAPPPEKAGVQEGTPQGENGGPPPSYYPPPGYMQPPAAAPKPVVPVRPGIEVVRGNSREVVRP